MIAKRRWPWVAQQNWNNVLFVHTPVPYKTLRTFVPYPFDIDTYDGRGWVTIVLFQATHSRLRFMSESLSYPPFFQMNMRTYVQFGDERGVYFFSINVSDPMVHLGGRITPLPFSKAHMTMEKRGEQFDFAANRLFGHPKSSFQITYKPKSPVFTPKVDSLSYFLSERYCIWLLRGNTIVKAPIFHSHWDLQHADIFIHERTHLPFPVTHKTVAHYARFKQSYVHPFETFGRVSGGLS